MNVFLMTEIEEATGKWEKHREVMGVALARHDALVQAIVAAHRGRVVKHTGDGIFAVFSDRSALGCALEMQRRFMAENWGELEDLRIRIGVHAGDVEIRGADYFGPAVNRTARLMAAAWGGQVLLTAEGKEACDVPAGAVIRDHGRHQFADLGEPFKVYELTHPELPHQEFPPIRSLVGHLHNLPPQPTLFLGRREEVSQVRKILSDRSCHLLTFIGAGGVGKTRLALQVAAELVGSFADGAYFVPLASLVGGSIQILVFTIGDAIRFVFSGSKEPRWQLLDYLREKEMLIVLDNFEHLVEDASLISDLVKISPRLKVLVTSRARLNLQGEHIYELGGLDVSETGDAKDAAESSAVQLFLQSAQRLKPDFALTGENLNAVINICRLVEGLPLAIEMAGAWVRTLSCWEILKELGKNIDFLSTTTRNVAVRHRSMRAVFDYSWDLLGMKEKQLYMRLSLFPGAFSRAAAESIAQVKLPELTAFVDKSLLRRNASGRFEILFLIRQFVAEMYDRAKEDRDQTIARFCAYYGAMLDVKLSPTEFQKEGGFYDQMAEEIANIRAAWSWALDRELWEDLGKMLGVLFNFLSHRSWLHEGKELFIKTYDKVLPLAKTDPLPVLATRIGSRLGILYRSLGNYSEARVLLEEYLKKARQYRMPFEIGNCLHNLGIIERTTGNFPGARRFQEEYLELASAANDQASVARVLNELGIIEYDTGGYQAALKFFDQSLQIHYQLDNKQNIATNLMNLGNCHLELADFVRAGEYFEQSLKLFKELKMPRQIGWVLHNMGRLALKTGSSEEALRLASEAQAIAKEIGDLDEICWSLRNIAGIHLKMGNLGSAARYYRELLNLAMSIRAVPRILEIMPGLAEIFFTKGDVETASKIVELAGSHPGVQEKVREELIALSGRIRAKMPVPDLVFKKRDYTPEEVSEFVMGIITRLE